MAGGKDKGRGPKKRPTKDRDSSPQINFISRIGWKLMGAGAAIAAIGYVALAFTDSAGKNWASFLAPILILLGYGLFGYGASSPRSA